VIYVGVNTPGSNNDWIADGDTANGPQAEADAEYTARNAANLQWLHECPSLPRRPTGRRRS